MYLHLPLTHLVPQVKGTQIKGREEKEVTIQAEQHEGALTHHQLPAATVASDPTPCSR